MVWGALQYMNELNLSSWRAIWMDNGIRMKALASTFCPSFEIWCVSWCCSKAKHHVARVVLDFLRRQNIQVMEWPVMSPDLAPIEHAWDARDRRQWQRCNSPRTLQDLGEALREVWQDIPQAFLAKLVMSMRQRCVSCVNARGRHTRYW